MVFYLLLTLLKQKMKIKAYTYLLIHLPTKKWYYGVRYAKNCKISDLMKTYFTSSKEVQTLIKNEGVHNFAWEIRKVFDNIEKAKDWEIKVLRRMKVTKNAQSFNKHYQRGFVVRYGDDNPSRNPRVIEKIKNNRKYEPTLNSINLMRDTKIRKNLIKFLLTNKNSNKISPKFLNRIELYLEFIIRQNKKYPNIMKKLYQIQDCVCFEFKPCPKRKSPKRGKIQKISDAKIGGKYYTNIFSGEIIVVKQDSLLSNEWVPGIKNKERSKKIRDASTNRSHTNKTKKKLSDVGKTKKYFTSPDLTEYRAFINTEPPKGWIPGIKVVSRNQKISQNSRWNK